jgi:hypothetical protein
MSKSRIPSAQRKTRPTLDLTSKAPLTRFLGLSLSGGKSDKSCLAVLDVYPDQKRTFLSHLQERIKSEEFISADLKILQMVEQLKEHSKSLSFDAPLTLPKCLQCPETCHSYETCQEPEVKWMREFDHNLPKKRPKKMFTPYTQRPVDLYLSNLEEENLEVQHTLGSNLAPLAARAQYLKRRITIPCLEVFPRLAVWRMGGELRVNKAHLRSYRNSSGGEDARRAFLNAWVEKAGLFLYQQDFKLLCENLHGFEALVCAWVGYLKEQGKTESPPKDFPDPKGWVEIPKRKVF